MEETSQNEEGREVRVRIAPSPTGPFHIGTARTALFNYIFAKKNNGKFILRIEDTDRERSEKKWEEEAMASLRWLGLEWDEGPDKGGEYGQYRQSERKEVYKRYIQKLLDEGKIYRCFCSKEDLEAHRQYLMSIGKPPVYSGKCRNLTSEEIKKNLEEGKPYVFRLKNSGEKIVFNDLLRGEIEYDSSLFGDIAITKGWEPLYNLACVIDDYEMGINYVMRGEDHIPNTPKQIMIAKALGISPPEYIHIPLLLGPDKTKLSKRHGAKSIMEYKEEGYLPEAMVNFLAFLGWNPKTDKEIFSISKLIEEFSIGGLQKSGAVFNAKKLDWLNGFYIRNKAKEKLAELAIPFLLKSGLIEKTQEEDIYLIKETKEKITFKKISEIIGLYQERLKKLSEISNFTDYFFKGKIDYPKEILIWKDMEEKEVKESLEKSKKTLSKIGDGQWEIEIIEEKLIKLADDFGKGDKGKILWPLRVALSGKKASAGPFEIAFILGKEKTIKRIKEAIEK